MASQTTAAGDRRSARTGQGALVDYAVKLTRAADLVPLREVGLCDLEILDLTHVIAMFAWANRLLETLGEVIYLPGETK